MKNKIIIVCVILLVIIGGTLILRATDRIRGKISGPMANADNSKTMKITSPAFSDGEALPIKYTCSGQGVNPELAIENVPENAKTLALILEDPDSPARTFVHWVLWNIKPDTKVIPENSIPLGAELGKNSAGELKYYPPCPPGGTHRYYFKLYALDADLTLPPGSDKDELLRAMQGHIIQESEIMGKYTKL